MSGCPRPRDLTGSVRRGGDHLTMGKRSRRHVQRQLSGPPAAQTTPPPPPAPERSLLNAIADGELDEHLTALADAVHARRHLVDTVRSATALAQLCVGDDVRINHTISPQYLRGLRGTITRIDDERATVCLHRPVGRFHTGEIRCPPLTLDKLAKAS
jgi:hypothetical protein